jgi:hypothetical protein
VIPVRAQDLSPMFGSLLGYWQQKRGARPLPARRDIDPVELAPELLPHLVLTDLLERGTRVRFRLVGTNVVKRFGFDPTGTYLGGEMSGGWYDFAGALYRLAYAERAPIEAASEFTWGPGRRLEAQHLLLPLSQDGPDPAIALCAFVFASSEPFPPTLRLLAECATHAEIGRTVLKTLPPATAAKRRAGREVA